MRTIKIREALKYKKPRFASELFAVRAGFEPAVQFNPYGSLANY